MEKFIVNQKSLAHALGINPIHLSRIKNNRKWTQRQAELLEDLTGIPKIEFYTLRRDSLNNKLKSFYQDQKVLEKARNIGEVRNG